MKRHASLGPPELGLGALLVASLVARLPFWRDCLHDDAFISLRYAHRLATGDGLTFNAGQRVEGYTNFLWTVLLAALERLGLDPVAGAVVLSVVPALALIGLVYAFGVRWARLPHRAWALVGAALVAVHPYLVAESVGGLETTLFVLLVFLGFERRVAETRAGARQGSAAAALALATLVRPEGALACLVILAALSGRRRPGWWARLGRDAGIYVLLVVPLFAFRLAYYGDVVPNTFHAKVGWNAAQMARGGRYMWYAFGLPSLVGSMLAVQGARGGGWPRAAAALVVAHVLYVVAVGGDFAPTARFLLVPLPFVALLAQSALVRLARARIGLAAAATLVTAGWAVGWEAERLAVRRWPESYRRDLGARRYLGKWFAAALPRDVTVAVGSIGAIGYYSNLPILDTFGLTDAEIGRARVDWMGHTSAGHEKGDADVVLRRAPRIIVFDRAFLAPRELGLDEFLAAARSPTEQLLVEDPRFYDSYGLRTIATPAGVIHFLERIP